MLKALIKSLLTALSARIGYHTLPLPDPRLWILMYHRVLPPSDVRYAEEEPGMIVHPETFEMHIKVLKQHFDIISLEDWVEIVKSGQKPPKRACAITFDDGWLDNYEYALPIIQKHNIPTTLFAVEGMIGTKQNFWPNRVAKLLAQLQLNNNDSKALQWMGEPALRCLSTDLPFKEQTAQVINHLKAFDDAYILEHMTKVEAIFKIQTEPTPQLMNWEQLSEMHDSSLVNVGCHTHSHIRLHQNLSDSVLDQELVQSKEALQEKLGTGVELFCYPNGDFNAAAYNLVKQSYHAAVSTKRGINKADQDLAQLLRIGVHEDISNTESKFKSRLSGWL